MRAGEEDGMRDSVRPVVGTRHRRSRLRAACLTACVLLTTVAGRGATHRSEPVSLDLLPADLRDAGSAILSSAPAERGKLVARLAEGEPDRAAAFLGALLEHEESPNVRLQIVSGLGTHGGAEIRGALERTARADADAHVSILALEKLRERDAADRRSLLKERLQQARKDGDAAGVAQLAQEDERWISLVHGTMLPAFLRRAPATFRVHTAGRGVRVVAFGDFGDGSPSQRATAAAIRTEHLRRPFDFGITLGDNMYEEGAESPEDPRWKSWWEDVYGPLGLRFYATLGNHDWKLSDSPAAEILYSLKSTTWSLPAPYYTFQAGDVQFFAVDTNEVSAAQLAWLDDQLAKSDATWKVVYGHHPIYSAGQHGDTARLVDELLPVLRGRADAYLCGHDHDMQHLKPDGGVQFFVAGSGGAHQRPMHPHPRTLFAKTDQHGFATIESGDAGLTVTFIADDGTQLYRYTLQKPLNR
jgi:tartrate-resistant acid phosphatase type 5